jgi:hypothetical protein
MLVVDVKYWIYSIVERHETAAECVSQYRSSTQRRQIFSVFLGWHERRRPTPWAAARVAVWDVA